MHWMVLGAGLMATSCDDGVVRPIRSDPLGVGGTAAGGVSSVAGGTGTVTSKGGATATVAAAGSAGDPAALCATSPYASLEDEALAQINDWRLAGVNCRGEFVGFFALLRASPSLRCAARVNSLLLFESDDLATPAIKVERYSAPLSMLDVGPFVDGIVFEGGPHCEILLDPTYFFAGIGFETTEAFGYWTFYFANSSTP